MISTGPKFAPSTGVTHVVQVRCKTPLRIHLLPTVTTAYTPQPPVAHTRSGTFRRICVSSIAKC